MKRCCYAFLFLFIAVQSLVAQPSLEIKSLEVTYPRVRIYFKVGCSGVNKNDFQLQNFEVYENGKLMTTATLHCFEEPDCCVSAVLVLDRSGSMAGQRFINMKTGANAFINEMNPDGQPCDEAAIVSFGSDVTLDVPMTSDKDTLLAGINNLASAGVTAMWDGVAVAIQELLKSAKNTCRAIIVLSDGANNASKIHTLNSVVQLALADSIRVFTIGLGSASDKNLPTLASLTGGQHFQSATGADLAAIYSAIRTGILGWSFPYCYLEYETGCPDGTERVVELTLKNYCGGTVTRTARYTAPYLPQMFTKVDLRIGNAEVPAKTDFYLPVLLETPVNQTFSKCYISIAYDESLLEFITVTTDGTLLAGKAFSFQRTPAGILIRLEEDVELNTTGGMLFKLHFRSKDPEFTSRTAVEILQWTFDAHCLMAVTHYGSVLVRARFVTLSCSATGPAALRWSEQKKGYEPTMFDVSVTVTNSGNKEIGVVWASLVVDRRFVSLSNPAELTQPLTPDTLNPGGSGSAKWTLELSNYKDLRSFIVRFNILVGDVLYTECEIFIAIDSAGSPFMTCQIDAPDLLRWSETEKKYDLNPFPVAITVHNASNIPVRNVRATITTDETVFSLIAPTQKVQAVAPETIPPGERATAQWTLKALGKETTEDVTVRITIESDNMPTIVCERIVRVEAAVYPILHCSVALPDSLGWNEILKRYEPNPFTITVSVPNSGSTKARNVRVTLITDQKVLRLLAPVANQQYLTPRDIPRGGTATAQWTLEVLEQSSAKPVSLTLRIEADNHAVLYCQARLNVDPALTTGIACEIGAPDTIYFREQYYEPEEFDIGVRVRNTGTAATRDVRAQLLQDTRFTIISSGSQLLADLLPAGDMASGSFRVRMHPRDTDGYDTVWVNIQGDDTDPVWCYYPIWVQRVRMPRFELTCTMESAAPVFDPASNDYIPNPLTIGTTAVNTGETWAEDCQIMLVGQTLLTPVGSTLRSLGTMRVNDSRREEWSVRVLPRATAGWDTLAFQVLGRGGLGRQIVVAECGVPVFVPATRQPAYTISCAAPDSVLFRDKRYQPDPLLYTARITNTGSSVGHAIRALVEPPATVLLASGESAERLVPALGTGESVDLTWRLQAAVRPLDGTHDICVRVSDSSGFSDYCCATVFIERSTGAGLALSCWTLDSLYVDEQTGDYLDNPFPVKFTLTNVGEAAAERVSATIIVQGNLLQVVGEPVRELGDINANTSVEFLWNVQALPQAKAVDARITIVITAENHAPLECRSFVHLPVCPMPSLATLCVIEPSDTLFFNQETGEYEPPEVLLTMHIDNSGQSIARGVRAYVLLPEAMTLSPGESAIKVLSPSDLAPGGRDSLRWRFRPMRSDASGWRDFRGVAGAENGSSVECVVRLYVQGAKRHVAFSFPEYTLLRYREKRSIPLFVDRTVVARLSEYVLRVEFDPSLLFVRGVSTEGTLTGAGWVGASMRQRGEGVIEITDYTTGAPLAAEAGVLLKLQVEGILGRTQGTGAFGETAIRIDTVASTLNRGAISYTATAGLVVVTDECLEPLDATAAYGLRQNRPNPFNPSTVIAYTLPVDEYIRLRVFDRHGRDVAVLEAGMKEQGEHSVTFVAENLPSGVYFYRLETPRGFETRKMVLMR